MRSSLRKCTQVCGNAHKFAEIHTSSWKCTQVHGNTHKFSKMHTSSPKYTQVFENAHKFAEIHSTFLEYTQLQLLKQKNITASSCQRWVLSCSLLIGINIYLIKSSTFAITNYRLIKWKSQTQKCLHMV